MNHQIEAMMRAAEGRYLNKKEQLALLDFFSKLEGRLKVMDELEAKESTIVSRVMEDVMRAYPDFEQKYNGGKGKGLRDLALVLRYISHAAARGDHQWLDDALLSWFNTILKGIGFSPEFIIDVYRSLERTTLDELSPASAEVVKPFLAQCIASLSARTPQLAGV